MTPAGWTALAAGLQFLATAILVCVTIQYVGAADRQADATEDSLRLLARQERRTATEELSQMRSTINPLRNTFTDYAHEGALRQLMLNERSHGVDTTRLEELRATAAALMPLNLRSPELVLDAVDLSWKVARKWKRARQQLEKDSEEGTAFHEVHEAAVQARDLWNGATEVAKEELQELPRRPV